MSLRALGWGNMSKHVHISFIDQLHVGLMCFTEIFQTKEVLHKQV